jgi:hypothetical protein
LFYTSITRLAVTVKVSPADPDGLRRTFETANGACDWISEQAHHKTFRQLALDKLVYYQVRERFGLSAQMAVRGIAKVVDAYALNKRFPVRCAHPELGSGIRDRLAVDSGGPAPDAI